MNSSARYIADRVRLMIATKQFQVGEILPSTRELGKQLQASFHTVRKAYQQLQAEGFIKARGGGGYEVVRQSTGLDKSQRLELGAQKVQLLVEELVGYGLDENEIELLFEEQLEMIEWPDRIQTCATVGETKEIALMLSSSIRKQVGVNSKILTTADAAEAAQYDALFIPIQWMNGFRHLSENLHIIPIVYSFDPDILLEIVERAAIETIGLVTAQEQTIPRIISELKQLIHFEGAFVAGSTYGKSLPYFVGSADMILYTPEAALLVESKIPQKNRMKLEYVISEKSIGSIRAELWEQ